MRNRLLGLISVIFLSTLLSYGQDSQNYLRHIADYSKVWGIIKYYQSEENTYCTKMDSVFKADINKLYHPKLSNKRFNQIIKSLIGYNLPSQNYNDKEKPNGKTGVEISPDFSWLKRSTLISEKNKGYLYEIISGEISGSSCYCIQENDNEQINFINDQNVLALYPDVENRILAVAQFWNKAFFYFAYINLIEVDWNEILISYIDKVIKSTNAEEYNLSILELSVLLQDSHVSTNSYVLDLFWGVYKLPVEIRNYNDKVFITEVYADTSLNNPFELGDEIIEINGVGFVEHFCEMQHLVPGSNIARKKYNFCSKFIRTSKDNALDVKVARGFDTLNIQSEPVNLLHVTRFEKKKFFQSQPIAIYYDSIGYMDLSQLTANDFSELYRAVKDTKYLILDLRKYPNLILDSLAELLFNSEQIIANWYSPLISKPGVFINRKPIHLGRLNDNAYNGNIYILVNSGSQSRAEFFTMALQRTPSNLTFGSQTSGANGNVTKFILPGSISSSFSGLGIKYPNGDQTQQKGIKIDIEFLPQGYLIKDLRDEELEFVLNYILESK